MKHDINGIIALLAAFTMTGFLAAMAEITVIDQTDPEGKAGGGINVPTPRDDAGAGRDSANIDDVLEFINKDRLHGALLSIEPSSFGLKWKHANAEKPIDFGLATIAQIKLGRKPASPEKAGASSVVLSNDDILTGTLVSMDADKLLLQTWYAGKISIKRAMVRRIYMGLKSKSILYEGPSDISEWTISRGGGQQSWTFKNGALISSRDSPIAKNIDNLPDMVDFEFDVGWRTPYPAFSFVFFNDNLANQANCYMLQVTGSSIYLYRYDRRTGNQHLGSIDYQRLANGQATHLRFNMLVDKPKKAFTLMLEGQMIKQWVDPASFVGMGKVIMFCPQGQGSIKISNIRVSEWDGKIPQATGAAGGENEIKDDLVRFVNADKVSGKLKAISSQSARFETSYAAMDIPLDRISEVIMATASQERARRNKDDVRAVFAERGIVTVQLTRLGKNTVSGISENFGDISMPLDAFRLLEFNIYREKAESAEDEAQF